MGPTEFGMVLTIRGVAGILGGLVMSAVGNKFKPNHLIPFGLVTTGLGLVAMVFWPIYAVSLLIMILMSVPIMAWLISSQTWIQTHAPEDFRGRVFGVLETFSALLMLIRDGICKRNGRNPGHIQHTLCGRGDLHPVWDPGSNSPAGDQPTS